MATTDHIAANGSTDKTVTAEPETENRARTVTTDSKPTSPAIKPKKPENPYIRIPKDVHGLVKPHLRLHKLHNKVVHREGAGKKKKPKQGKPAKKGCSCYVQP